MRRFLVVLTVVGGMLALQRERLAGQPAPELAEYEVTPAAGPWLICATSYLDDSTTGRHNAAQLALRMVQEIRAKYQLPAYVYNRSAVERQKQQEEIRLKRQQQAEQFRRMGLNPADAAMLRIRTVKIEDQFAVLVGGYRSMEAAREALDDFRRRAAKDPPSKELCPSVFVQDLGDPKDKPPPSRSGILSFLKADPERETRLVAGKLVNPFQTAFVTHNPTVPLEKPEAQPDPFLKELNAHESYSLLKCKKPWTLVVKDFRGASVAQPLGESGGFLEKIGFGKSSDLLGAAGLQAHELARVLRQWNFEAYVLHTRYYSLVTVGGYDRLDDPKLQQMQRQLANLKLKGVDPRQPPLLYAHPVPMEVPRP